MTLADFEIFPAVVVSSNDPMNEGRVKANAPGVFDTSDGKMTEDDLMWISPFCMVGHQSFSKLEIGSKIWVLHNSANYFEYWYIPMFEMDASTSASSSESADVVFSRSVGGQDVSLRYSPSVGCLLVIGDNRIQLDSSGNLNIISNGHEITADSTGVNIGLQGGEYQPAVLGDSLNNLFNTLYADLLNLAASAASTPWTARLAPEFFETAERLKANVATITSSNVNIN